MINKDRINLRKNASRSYFIGLSVVVAGMLIFLTSGFYIDEELEVLASPVGEEIRITSATNIEILEWIYDEEKNEMEVIIDLNEYKYELNDMEFVATQRSDLSQVNVELALEYEQYIVLKIDEIDRDYTQISLRFLVNNEEETAENENEQRHLVSLYADYREIDHGTVKVDEQKESLEYITAILIKQSEENISLLEEEITGMEEEVNGITEQIEALHQEKQYQTSEEKLQTDNRINALEVEKNELKTEQDRARERISIEEERIQNLIQRERDSSLSYS